MVPQPGTSPLNLLQLSNSYPAGVCAHHQRQLKELLLCQLERKLGPRGIVSDVSTINIYPSRFFSA